MGGAFIKKEPEPEPENQPIKIKEEVKIKDSNIIIIPKTISRVSKSLCKIDTGKKIATGFLIKLLRGEDNFFCLMTNEHAITKDMIERKEKIVFYYDSDKIKEIYLNTNERFIKEFRDINIDATVVQILPEDKIKKSYFLLPNTDYINNSKELIDKEIEIPQYPEGILSFSKGIIKDIYNSEIIHLASTDEGSSGSPLFLKDTVKVIGIHYGSMTIGKDEKNKQNLAHLIEPIFNYFLNMNNKIKYENGEYYKGDILNGKAYGKGILYYKNGKKKYEGNFINDKKEGKGLFYYKNGKKKYDGEFINNKAEGEGV